ncbi:MAG: hypothetical protein JNK67_26800 [Alphaproteobacteria bacterium]|nr:hypothetical protein [Alphaproteobacteria bacterium]
MRAEHPKWPSRGAPGPDNPLGAFALDLARPRIVIHGTNRPCRVGRRFGHPCIRPHDASIAFLHDVVSVGTEMCIVDEPVKLGWA